MKIAVNKNCLNKENPQLVAKGWKNILVDINYLLGWVAKGYGWCATHFIDRYRKAENASGSNLVVIDFDGDTTLDAFWATQTAKVSGALLPIHHQVIATRSTAFRALFPLEKDLETVPQHRGAYWLIVNRLLADLGLEELKDNCGQKPERLWYGSTDCTSRLNDGAMVPAFLLDDIDYEEPTDFVHTDCEEIDVRRCQWLLREFLRPSDDDEYESYYVPVMAACAGVGSVLFDDWVEWVLRGHHGHKEENSAI